MPLKNTKTWDIFCRVIDNYGDIGVCWRLARQLAGEHQQSVRLWVDELDALIRIWPEARRLNRQQISGVEVCRWNTDFAPNLSVADVVIEAFACAVPASYLHSMAAKKAAGEKTIWINLEYLSAEKWIENCHGLRSTHPTTGLHKTFFFPGFNANTGGLLREKSLLQERDQFQSQLWLQEFGVVREKNALLISLFAYENPAIRQLLEAWSKSGTPIHCLVPEGKILTSINHSLGKSLMTSDIYRNGNLCLQVIPFINQIDYDRLLWACDINFVRGEDSFVRAQWAAKPLIWHIYPQDEDVHLIKLSAFLDIYTAAQPASGEPLLAIALRELWSSWNGPGDIQQAWQRAIAHLTEWQLQSRDWCDLLTKQPDLSSELIAFCTTRED